MWSKIYETAERLSVCTSILIARLPNTNVAGVLLRAQQPWDINLLLHSRRSEASSVTLLADVRSWTHGCYHIFLALKGKLSLHIGWTDVTRSTVTIRSPVYCGYNQWCIAKNGGGYTQSGVAKGLKVPCLFMITEVTVRWVYAVKKPRRLIYMYAVYPRIPPTNTPLGITQYNVMS